MKGLVLEGGGTKGAYQFGAYKALKELGIEFNGVSGTSIGALNGAFIVQDDFENMEDIWLNKDYKSFMDIEEDFYEKYKNIAMKPKNINAILELINKVRKNEGIDITPLRNLLKENIDSKAKEQIEFELYDKEDKVNKENVRLVTLEFEDFCKQGTEKQFDENKHLNEQTRFIYNKLKKLL